MSGPELATTRLAGAAGHLPLHLVLPTRAYLAHVENGMPMG